MKSKSTTEAKLQLYTNFQGVITARPDVALENAEAQAFSQLDNAVCSARGGYLANERPLLPVGDEKQSVIHARYYAGRKDSAVYAARTGRSVSLRVLDVSAAAEDVWPRDAIPASCVFNRAVVVTAAGQQPMRFDGGWRQLTSSGASGARYCAAVQDRLVLAGFDTNDTEVLVSRVNKEDIFPADESDAADLSSSIIKAFRFNISNLVGTAEKIKGLASFETNRLAIFTDARVLVYVADENLEKWTIDEKAGVSDGTVSHNSIAARGDELLFCSRSGIRSLKRSALNGVTMFTLPLSADISELYESLLSQVPDPESITAFFDGDAGRYHVFFPVAENKTYRLSLDLASVQEEGKPVTGTWSTSSFALLQCGDSLAGNVLFGSASGFQLMLKDFAVEGVRGAAEAVTPVLWHKDLTDPKASHTLVLYASGVGRVTVTGESETGRKLSTVVFDLPAADQANYLGAPLAQQYERPFQHQYVGLRLRVRIESNSQVRVVAIGVRLREV